MLRTNVPKTDISNNNKPKAANSSIKSTEANEIKEQPKLSFFERMGEKPKFIIGLLIIVCNILLFIAFISHLIFAGDADQSVVEFGVLAKKNVTTPENSSGSIGAYFANLFITKGFGIIAILLPPYFILFGASIFLNNIGRVVKKLFPYLLMFMYWLPTFFGLINRVFDLPFRDMSGDFGLFINEVLGYYIGNTGVSLLLLFSATAFFIVKFNLKANVFGFLNKTVGVLDEKIGQKEKPDASSETNNQPVNNDNISAQNDKDNEIKVNRPNANINNKSETFVIDKTDKTEIDNEETSTDSTTPKDFYSELANKDIDFEIVVKRLEPEETPIVQTESNLPINTPPSVETGAQAPPDKIIRHVVVFPDEGPASSLEHHFEIVKPIEASTIILKPEDITLEIEKPLVTETYEDNNHHISIFQDNIRVISDDLGEKIIDPMDKESIDADEDVGDWESYDPTKDLSTYIYPTIELLRQYDNHKGVEVDRAELEANKNQIVKTLQNYGIEIIHIKATIGPTITLYEIIPAPGVRISKIKNLEDDIALSLAALGIRIIAPMPGKGTIGIEIPNSKPEIVSFRHVIATEKFKNTEAQLPIGIGKTISNEVFIADLTKMPHLLVAGATGQGKSVGLNCIIASLLYKKHPSQIKFVLIDPKKVELTLYQALEKHFLAKLPNSEESIITDNRQVINVLNSLCMEMDNRYKLLQEARVRNINEYNIKFTSRKLSPKKGHKYLPYIVLIIDELADLMMTAGKEIETPIARLAQLARAVGIHLVVATQRPSVNVITGVIKANFPARLSYRVISKIDSRTILDSNGAEQLIGRGDMLLFNGSELIRMQNAFIDTDEVERLVEHISKQMGYPEPYYLPEVVTEENEEHTEFTGDKDKLFEDAARLVVRQQNGSTSLIQRHLKIGFNRAGRIMDQLEAAGIVGAVVGSKPREVFVFDERDLEKFL